MREVFGKVWKLECCYLLEGAGRRAPARQRQRKMPRILHHLEET